MKIVSFTPRSQVARAGRALALAALLAYAFTGGGRLVGSDEVSMFELSLALVRGSVAVPPGATLAGPDGRHYTKNAATQAVLALPLVLAGETAARAVPLSPPRRTLAARFVTSFFNAFVAAILLGVFYVAARRLGVSSRVALWTAVLLGFSTPLWVYSKSFMAEPLQALGLLLALAGCAGVGDDPGRAGSGPRPASAWSERAAALGVFLAVSVKLSMLPLGLVCMVTLVGRPARAWLAPTVGLVLALAGHALYNQARFGTLFETGYGVQVTAAAYTTPFLAGIYGLVISSGKGVLWFAPVLWIALPVWLTRAGATQLLQPPRDADVAVRRTAFSRFARLDAEARVRWGAALAGLAALWLYGRFQHWAGDGSFGPRYLVPVLPLAFLVVALTIERGARAIRRWAIVLGVLGGLVQVGGVAIYFGAQMREAGDYPYTLPLDHPRSMSDSHFNPRFSPIAGHWRLLLRNVGEHVRGAAPRIGAGRATAVAAEVAAGTDAAPSSGAKPRDAALNVVGDAAASARLGIDSGDQEALLHAIDFWWLYLIYAGFPAAPVWGVALALFVATVLAARRAWRLAHREGKW